MIKTQLWTKNNCLSYDAMLAYKKKDLSGTKAEQLVLEHLNQCGFCQEAFEGIEKANEFEFTGHFKTLRNNIPRVQTGQAIKHKSLRLRTLWWAAAVISFVLGSGYLYTLNQGSQIQNVEILASDNTIIPQRPNPGKTSTTITAPQVQSPAQKKSAWTLNSEQEAGNFQGKIFEAPEVMPEFPGGIIAFNRAIQSTIENLKQEVNTKICGNIEVQFYVDKEGKIKQASVSGRTSERIKNKLSKLILDLPEFSPGKQMGENVTVKMRFPLSLGRC